MLHGKCACAFHGRRFYAIGDPQHGYAVVEVTITPAHRVTWRTAEARHPTLRDAEREAHTYRMGCAALVAWHP